MTNELLDNLLQPQLSQALLERERNFKQIYSLTFERCREQTTRSRAYRNRFKLGHHLQIGQKVLYENHKQDITRSQNLQERRLGPFTVTKSITNTTYQIQVDKDPTVVKTVHRNHLVEYYPKELSLPAMIEEFVPSNYPNDHFYERFMEQRTRDINNQSATEEHDSFPFPIEPSRSISSTNKPKRSSMHSNNSEILLHLLLLAPLCYHPQFHWEHQPFVHLLLSTPNLFKCRLGNILAQFNNLFATVPLAWIEVALTLALKSPKTIARSKTTQIFSQY